MRNPSSSSSLSAPANLQKKSSGGGGKMGLKRGPWTTEEDELLTRCISKEGEGKWRTLPTRAGLVRCGKSCRLRWMNYLRPSVKRGQIAPDEEDLILRLHRLLGNRWSLIAGRIPGRTDNEIKNYWNTHMSKKLISQGIDPKTHKPLLETSKSGKKSDSDNSGSSKMVTETHDHQSNAPTSSGQNPNMHHHHHQQQQQQYCSGSAADGGFWNASDGAEAGCYSDGYGYDHTSMNLADGAGGYHVNLHQRSSQGLSDEDGGGGGGGGDGISCEGMVEDNEVFSSFLNSLINDDMFV